ncbi:histidine kinase [Flavisolibacter sp. BT320]|nr:histidine kinase [Flavisolibacter longurius]
MMSRQTFLHYKLHHLCFWLVLGAIWYYLRYQDYATWQQAFLVTLVKVVDLALLVGIANYVLIPRFLYRKKYVLFSVLLLSLVAASSYGKLFLVGTIINDAGVYNWTTGIKQKIYDNILPHIFLVIAGMAVKLLTDYNAAQKRLLQIAREKAETELNFLKSQINPHFLFNSLNAVYFLIDKNNAEARRALHKFSEMLRYQLYEVKDVKIDIEKEISYLQDYIGLQQLRIENCDVTVQIEPSVKGFAIEPLLLLPFVENSFKHLSHFSNGSRNTVSIALTRKNGEMQFSIQNTTEAKVSSQPYGGIGLTNVKRRLELLYPQKHQLEVAETDGWYRVQLKLKL